MVRRHLHVSDDFAFPPDAVTGTIVVYGNRGTGKTNFGSVLAEELSKSNLRFSVVDPVGVWWGLQHNGEGTGPGLDVLMLGGRRGDLPIVPTAGAVVADMVVDEDISVVIDISSWPDGKRWSKGDKIRFVKDYATRLYERQGEQKRPLMQIIDEAARFIPQMIPKHAVEVAECMGAIEDIVEEGRNVGLGVCLLTQRSARMNKSVSELCECMLAFRTVGPNSVQAVVDWFGAHIKKERWAELIESLRELPVGQALVASPGWLKYEGLATIRMRETFDSSATPNGGIRGRGPKKLTRRDLDKYQERMQATVQEAETRDPRKAQAALATRDREIERLKGEVVRLGKRTTTTVTVRSGVTDTQVARLEKMAEEFRRLAERQDAQAQKAAEAINRTYDGVYKAANKLAGLVGAVLEKAQKPPARVVLGAPSPGPFGAVPASPSTTVDSLRKHREAFDAAQNGDLSRPQANIMRALATFASLGQHEIPRKHVAAMAGASPRSSAFSDSVSKLRKAGLIDYTSAGRVKMTPEGREAWSGHRASAVSTKDLFDGYRRHVLSPYQVKVFDALERAYPETLSREELAERAGVSVKSSAFAEAVSDMKALGLVEYEPGGRVRMSETMFVLGRQ